MPPGIKQHLTDRLDRIPDFAKEAVGLKLWIESQPTVPEGKWFKSFGTFFVCGDGQYITTFLDGDMAPYGEEVP